MPRPIRRRNLPGRDPLPKLLPLGAMSTETVANIWGLFQVWVQKLARPYPPQGALRTSVCNPVGPPTDPGTRSNTLSAQEKRAVRSAVSRAFRAVAAHFVAQVRVNSIDPAPALLGCLT